MYSRRNQSNVRPCSLNMLVYSFLLFSFVQHILIKLIGHHENSFCGFSSMNLIFVKVVVKIIRVSLPNDSMSFDKRMINFFKANSTLTHTLFWQMRHRTCSSHHRSGVTTSFNSTTDQTTNIFSWIVELL